jgi:hypothetical protein
MRIAERFKYRARISTQNQFKTNILVVVLFDKQITSPKQFSPKTTLSGY